MLGRPSDARPGFDLDVKVVGQNAEAGAPATVFAAMSARAGHPDKIARSAEKQKSPILRRTTIREGAQKYLRAAKPEKPIAKEEALFCLVMGHTFRLGFGETANPRNTSKA